MLGRVLVGVGFACAATAGPLRQQVRVTDPNGAPVDGARDVRVQIVGDATPGAPEDVCHTTNLTGVMFQDGYATIDLASVPIGCFQTSRWVAVSVGTPLVELAPRTPISEVPVALLARGVGVEGAASGSSCTTTGALVYDTSLAKLRVCDGTSWVAIGGAAASGGLGTSQTSPATSCTQVRTSNPAAPTDTYWIHHTGTPALAIEVYCVFGGANGTVALAAFEEAQPPLHYWDMTTAASGGGLADLIGSNKLVAVGTPTTSTDGVIGGSGSISNASSWWASQSDFEAGLTGATNKSISAWFKTSSTSGDGDNVGPIFGFGSVCSSGSFSMALQTGNPNFIGCGNDLGTASGYSNNAWHHIVATYDGTTVRIYLDGALAASGAKSLNTQLGGYGKYTVGADPWWSTTLHHYTSGLIDEPKVYNFTLTAGQVTALYDLGNAVNSP
jgi:hypothetical protein